MKRRILITGGAGFIGSHLSDLLLRRGYSVRALDRLDPQVHGPDRERPEYLNREVELLRGDVRDADAVSRALDGIDSVVHLAAAVGVGQSMYEIARYVSTNAGATAILLEALLRRRPARLIVASSMSLYGEGLYLDEDGRPFGAAERELDQLRRREWEPRDGAGRLLSPAPTPETKPPSLESVYALSKYDQERLSLLAGRAYGFPVSALRFFNVYGPRQALSNPYTGVLAIFASRLLNGKPPLIFEDGKQRRDFVSVHDVARACLAALEAPASLSGSYNIGSGTSMSIAEVAAQLGTALGMPGISAQITGEHRVGDVRHCFADVSKARRELGYVPEVSFEAGLRELAVWLEGRAASDRVGEARSELSRRGLTL
jgi:dTDP-L-rhamnose 4-epimerase